LTVWRGRLRRSARPNRIFDAVRAVVAQTGVLTGKTRRALDSTILDDAVATQDTVTQLVAAIRRVARVVPGATEVIAQQCRAHDYTGLTTPGRGSRGSPGTTKRPARNWSTPWSRMRIGCWGICPSRNWGRRPRTRWRCWR
jgi:hypothetical protein